MDAIIPQKKKFSDPHVTTTGAPRARVDLKKLEVLWFNTGTLCNLECGHCYIESSPTNDRLSYISAEEVRDYLEEVHREGWPVRDIGFTGGEPFMNPDIMEMLEDCLQREFRVLVLTNAMKPMQHKTVGLLALKKKYGPALRLRVSVDHYDPAVHERERGTGSWAPMVRGLQWLAENGFNFSVAGRTFAHESEARLRIGYQHLFDQLGISLTASDPTELVLFPEMDETADVPEITTACWEILNVAPEDMMCATSRMVVKRRGAARPVLMPCTLLAYDKAFEMGECLGDMKKTVALNHPHCARFCVLGGASCSG
ncbi:radical SAM protein [Luteithermobacter gelatinilyticus]|uniref:radical SAM protein n=1 Tax=Luteithermobacter gelatinilyticus TaxID=2582913 RepID=UPI001106988D|nr:radical SAM protein [Luteithermobacter gelatinilyticus]